MDINKKKSRSSLRRAPAEEDETTTVAIRLKKRISFSGKKSVREFIDTEEPKNWDYSCEVSDHFNGDDSSSAGRDSKGASKPSEDQKENIPQAANVSSHIDVTLNLQTSVDVTMLPCEVMPKNARKDSLHAESLFLSSDEREKMHNHLWDPRFMDKTIDLMSGSLVGRHQSKCSVLREDFSMDMLPEREPEKTPLKPAGQAVGDSFMDITPLAYPAAPPEAPPEPSFMELETQKVNLIPAQKSAFMDLEDMGKEKATKNKTQIGAVDISFDCPLNVSEDRDRMSAQNSFESANSTINYLNNESALIPFDMISGHHISKKINFRQLNDELEAGKIQLFPNGPKTPTTDRKTKRSFWHGLEQEPMEDGSPVRDIRSIKPRGTLNFSENMMMSPAMTTSLVPRKEKMDEKLKYRFSQADELMLNNTNFLAHAKLGDETQSRNTSKNSTRRETTYDNSVLDFQPIPSSKPRQTLHMAEAIEQDKPAPPVNPSKHPAPPRRTLHMNESMDQDGARTLHVRKEIEVTKEVVVTKATVMDENEKHQATQWESTKTKRRETLLLQESMEVDIVSPLKELQLNKKDVPQAKVEKSKPRHTLHLAEPLDEENVSPNKDLPLKISAPQQTKSKARQTLLLEQPMEEEVDRGTKESKSVYQKTKVRQTMLLEEPIEEEMRCKSNDQPIFKTNSRPRQTLIMSERIEEEEDAPRKICSSQQKKFKGRQTLLLEEPMEEEMGREMKDPSAGYLKSKPRQTLLLEEPIEEEFHSSQPSLKPLSKPRQTLIMSEQIQEEEDAPKPKDLPSKIPAPQQNKFRSRQTLLVEEPMEEVFDRETKAPPSFHSKSKSRQTLLLEEPIEEEMLSKTNKQITYESSKPRQTLIMSEQIPEEEDDPNSKVIPQQNKPKSRQTLLLEEPMEEETDRISNDYPLVNSKSKSRQTLFQEEEEMRFKNYEQHRSKSRQTLIMSEQIEEEEEDSNPKEFAPQNNIFKARQTLFSVEPMDEEMTRKTKDPPVINSKTKSRQTLYMEEPIEEDVDPPDTYSKQNNHRSKSRQTIIMSEGIEEEDNASQHSLSRHKAREASQNSKSRQTLLLAEPIEEETSPYKPINKTQIKSCLKTKSAFLMAEDFNEEEVQPSVGQQKSKSRQTLAQPIDVEDMGISGISPIEENVAKDLELRVINRSSKSRQTILQAEPIEEDVDVRKSIAKWESKAAEARSSKARQTLVMAEPIEEDGEVHQRTQEPSKLKLTQFMDQSLGQKATKTGGSNARNTLFLAEDIDDEEEVHKPMVDTKMQTPFKPRNTQFMEESLEEEASKNLAQSYKSRQTLLLAEPIEEDTDYRQDQPKNQSYRQREPVTSKNISLPSGNRPAKGRQTLHMNEPMDEDLGAEEPKDNKAHKSVGRESSKKRQTLYMAELIEEEGEPLIKTNNFKDQHQLKARKTQFLEESIQIEPNQNKPSDPKEISGFDDWKDEKIKPQVAPNSKAHQTLVMSQTMDFQSPPETMGEPKMIAITPKNNSRHPTIPFTPGLSLCEFEDQEEKCKTPIPQRKQRSVYHSIKMDLEATDSVVGTPLRPPMSHLKRLPNHLTPNLPESKKRNTQHFEDSNMQVEMEEEQEKELDTDTNKSRIPIRTTFNIDQFDESVQPVRDYHAKMSYIRVPLPTELEEKPITISDVSKYFQEERQAEEQRKSGGRESGSSNDRTFKSHAVTINKFINLSGDTTIFAAAGQMDPIDVDQLDNEQLSLVSTMAEEADEAEERLRPEICQEEQLPRVVAGSSASCRNCRNCKRSLSETELALVSFALPQHDFLNLSKEREKLRRLRMKPTLEEVHTYWEVKIKELQLVTLEPDGNETMAEEKEKPTPWKADDLVHHFIRSIKRPAEGRTKRRVTQPVESFFDRLLKLLSKHQPNWIFNSQLKISKQMMFHHQLLPTFRIVVKYDLMDELNESAIRVSSISVDNEVAIPKQRWTAFYHHLDFQLSLKLPVNLTDAIEGRDEEAFLKFLQRIDLSCVEIKRNFHRLLSLLTTMTARLLREANRTVVKKSVWKVVQEKPVLRYEKINFLVEIANVDEITFTDILQPSIHLFDEKIQFLPKGIAFLEAFLPHPELYLKT